MYAFHKGAKIIGLLTKNKKWKEKRNSDSHLDTDIYLRKKKTRILWIRVDKKNNPAQNRLYFIIMWMVVNVHCEIVSNSCAMKLKSLSSSLLISSALCWVESSQAHPVWSSHNIYMLPLSYVSEWLMTDLARTKMALIFKWNRTDQIYWTIKSFQYISLFVCMLFFTLSLSLHSIPLPILLVFLCCRENICSFFSKIEYVYSVDDLICCDCNAQCQTQFRIFWCAI